MLVEREMVMNKRLQANHHEKTTINGLHRSLFHHKVHVKTYENTLKKQARRIHQKVIICEICRDHLSKSL